MDYRTATVIVAVDKQSTEIANSVFVHKAPEDIGAGDQGFMDMPLMKTYLKPITICP
jgi:S-adenosylmethionine synthetase